MSTQAAKSGDLPPAQARAVLPRRIVVVVDPTAQEQPAVDKAIQLAASAGASLELYVCDVEQDIRTTSEEPLRAHEYREARRERILEELRHIAEPLKSRGLRIEVTCEWHAPLEQGVGHHVIRTRPDLVVKGTSRHPSAPRVVLTRTDWNLIRQIPAPLLLAGPQPWSRTPRIAVAVDSGSVPEHPPALDGSVVEEAREVADALGGTLELFHVLQAPPHLPGDSVSPEVREDAHAQARLAARRLAHRADAAAVRFAEGRVVEGLADLARAHAPDVLVMGAVARPRWVHSAARGTAAQLLERVDCDLLVVKPPGFVSPLMVTED